MNLLQLTQRLHRESGRAGAGPTTLVGASKEVQRLADKIADAWLLLQQEPRNWKWMRRSSSPTIGAGLVDLSGADLGLTGFGRWRRPTREYAPRCYDPAAPQSVMPLEWREHDRFVRDFRDIELQPGSPQFWTIAPDETLMIAPAGLTDTTIKVDWIIDVTELAEDGDTPDMPARHHMILVWRALVDAGKADASPEDVSRAIDALRTMEDNLISDQADEIGWKFHPLA